MGAPPHLFSGPIKSGKTTALLLLSLFLEQHERFGPSGLDPLLICELPMDRFTQLDGLEAYLFGLCQYLLEFAEAHDLQPASVHVTAASDIQELLRNILKLVHSFKKGTVFMVDEAYTIFRLAQEAGKLDRILAFFKTLVFAGPGNLAWEMSGSGTSFMNIMLSLMSPNGVMPIQAMEQVSLPSRIPFSKLEAWCSLYERHHPWRQVQRALATLAPQQPATLAFILQGFWKAKQLPDLLSYMEATLFNKVYDEMLVTEHGMMINEHYSNPPGVDSAALQPLNLFLNKVVEATKTAKSSGTWASQYTPYEQILQAYLVVLEHRGQGTLQEMEAQPWLQEVLNDDRNDEARKRYMSDRAGKDGLWALGEYCRLLRNVGSHPPTHPGQKFQLMILKDHGGPFASSSMMLQVALACALDGLVA
ncbi:hypothetical protein WJX72_009253 [[Myrmecia] bisecta]|uniref:AAA+ ATPase domain-containing protein n=1 Tax=[Myrmecia] bisecta TaxID=41462 RepID=A0AAW1QS65_9CHLO